MYVDGICRRKDAYWEFVATPAESDVRRFLDEWWWRYSGKGSRPWPEAINLNGWRKAIGPFAE
jgi:hypothetical protein